MKLLDDGEVCFRGGNVFAGYLKDPERTAEVLDDDGWLHTGDIGQIDEDGYLKIVDRKKELIITAGGKNISPANLEAAIKSYPLIGQACAIGDGRPYMTALIVLDPDVAPAWAKSRGIEFTSAGRPGRQSDVRAEVERCVSRGQRPLLPGGEDQEDRPPAGRVAARLRRADPDHEAQAARRPEEVRRRDRDRSTPDRL